MSVVEYLTNKADEKAINNHLSSCNANFTPPLSDRVDIHDYVKKIATKTTRFEAWSNGTLVGLLAAYCNNQDHRIAYITSVSVLNEWSGIGIAASMMRRCIIHMEALGMSRIFLEVARDNIPAIRLYEKSGFVADNTNTPFVTMILYLKSGEEHEQQA